MFFLNVTNRSMKTCEEMLQDGVTTDTGAMVYSVTGLPAESTATLHALNSREPGGFGVNIKKMFDGAGKIISRILKMFYISYGHKSIGDCATADVFVDNVSMLVPNAFQHNWCYSGQETSSRYVDVTVNGYHIPNSIKAIGGEIWMDKWMDFYQRAQVALMGKIQKENPFVLEICPEGKDPEEWEKSKKAEWEKATRSRSYDIAGAFLPCGARTNFSEVINLRQWSDQLQTLFWHPLEEVRDVARATFELLCHDHPNSFKVSARPEKVEYEKWKAEHLFAGYFSPTDPKGFFARPSAELNSTNIKILEKILSERPAGCDLPFETARFGGFHVESLIDFRSYRDLHRHRPVSWVMPVVSPLFGFESWYLNQLPAEFFVEAVQLIGEYTDWYKGIEGVTSTDLQYTTPMGFLVPVQAYVPLPAAVYLAELRSKLTVHPTARRWAINLAESIKNTLPDLKIEICIDPDMFCLERGKHDIVKKG